jgi:hypothetical protein
MSPRLLRPKAGGFHPEAADWRSRVVANGGTVSGSTLKAVDAFCKSIDSAGLRSLLWRVNPMAGDNLSAALVPLYRSNVALGLQGNATDTNNNFVGGDFGAATGLQGNGSSKSLDTGLSMSFATDRHVGFVPRSLGTTAFRYYMGARNSGFNALFAPYVNNPTSQIGFYNYSDTAAAGGSLAVTQTVRRLYLASSNPSIANGCFAYSDGVSAGAGNVGQSNSHATTIAIFAMKQADNSFTSHTNALLSGYTIGLSLTASQAASYNTIWTALLTALGRA